MSATRYTKKSWVLSLFDYTGEAVKPWVKHGYRATCLDIQHKDEILGDIAYLSWDASAENVGWLWNQYRFDPPEFIFSFAPCTDLAVSGAAHFQSKYEKDPLFQTRATDWAMMAEALGKLFQCPYMVENPVSRLSTLWRPPDYIFHPYEYGGYLTAEEAKHPIWPDYIRPYDAYPKKTCLWTGGGFVLPPKKPVTVPDGYSLQHLKLGGKSTKTKNIRSATPRGFAKAVCEYNRRK